MSSTIAGSVAAVTISPVLDIHRRSNSSLKSNSGGIRRLTSFNSFDIIRRTSMGNPNNNDAHAQSLQGSTKVTMNIRGSIFETFESTLSKYPDTLLGSSSKRAQYYDSRRKQYIFDRNKDAFDAILYYYQSSGKLIRPEGVDEEKFLEDLEFFQIDPRNVAELEYGSTNFKLPKDKKSKQLSHSQVQENSQRSCSTCQIFLSWPCGIIVVLFMSTLCLSSVSEYQLVLPSSCVNVNKTRANKDTKARNDDFLIILQYLCGFWFLLEFILRFITAKFKFKYVRSFLGAVDFTSVLSIFLQILLRQFDACQVRSLKWSENLFRMISILCLFKLARYSTGLKLFGLTVKACSGQLILSFYCVGICLLLFSSVIYYSEETQNSGFSSILDAFWYTIVTLTTVGYGDLVPGSIVGKICGGICSVFGVTIVVAWPATIFVSYFTEIYNHEIGKKKKKNRKSWSKKVFRFKKGLIRLDKQGCTFR